MIEAFIISFAILLNKSLAQPMAMPDCPTLMYSPNWAGIPSYFPGMVAHGVHSMTLPDIDFYFPNNKVSINSIEWNNTLPLRLSKENKS